MMEGLWQSQMAARADEIHAEIDRLRAEQGLARDAQLRRISPTLKRAISDLLRTASASRKLFALCFLKGNSRFQSNESEDNIGGSTDSAVLDKNLLPLITFLKATFTQKRCAKFLATFVPPPTNDADLSLKRNPNMKIWRASSHIQTTELEPAWPVALHLRARSGLAHILLVDRDSGIQQQRFSTRISAERPIEGILQYLSIFCHSENCKCVELYLSIGGSIYHIDCPLTTGLEQMMSEKLTAHWKAKAAEYRDVRVTCSMTAINLKQRLTGTFMVEEKPVFRLAFPADSSTCINLRDCRQLIEDAVRELPLVDDAAERHSSRLFSSAISYGTWNFMRRGLIVPMYEEPEISALELAIETGSSRMQQHSMEESLKFAVSCKQ